MYDMRASQPAERRMGRSYHRRPICNTNGLLILFLLKLLWIMLTIRIIIIFKKIYTYDIFCISRLIINKMGM
jgi:hypothetical protein